MGHGKWKNGVGLFTPIPVLRSRSSNSPHDHAAIEKGEFGMPNRC